MFLACIAFIAWFISVVGVPLSSRVAIRAAANIELLQTVDQKSVSNHVPLKSCPRDEAESNTLVTAMRKQRLEEMASSIHLGRSGLHLRIGCALKVSRLSRQRTLDAIQTWGKRCDAIYAFSNEEWTLPGNMGVTTILLKQHDDDYAHLWQKTQAMFESLSRVYWDRDSLDFLVMADDDTFFIMENLRALLASEPVRTKQATGRPILIGDLWEGPANGETMRVWVNGGGYVFNRVVADEVSKCTGRLAQGNIIPEDVMVCSCMVRSDWQFDLYQESNGCDTSGRKMFSQDSILTTWGNNDTMMSRDLIEFHHTVGEERYHFFRSLYNDDSLRLCVDASASELEDLQANIRHEKGRRVLAWKQLTRTLDHGLWQESPSESLSAISASGWDRRVKCPAPEP